MDGQFITTPPGNGVDVTELSLSKPTQNNLQVNIISNWYTQNDRKMDDQNQPVEYYAGLKNTPLKHNTNI